jgi:hypothetical protein
VGVEQPLMGVPETPSDLEAQDGLRRALGDPSLQLVLWDPEARGYPSVIMDLPIEVAIA